MTNREELVKRLRHETRFVLSRYGGLMIEAADALEADAAVREQLAGSLEEILNYRGGADSALSDEYVMDRAAAAIAAAKG